MQALVIHNHPIHYKHLLFSELKRQGLDFEVVFLGTQSSTRFEPINLSDDLYRSTSAWPGPYETAPPLRKFGFTWRRLTAQRPDVVIISGYYAAECWSAWAWALLHRRPIILWHESNQFDHPRHWLKELPKRIFCKGVTQAHVYGITNKEYLIELGIPASRVEIRRAVVDVERFSRPLPQNRAKDNRETRLLYVGRLAPEKNLDFLLRAFAAVANGAVRKGENPTLRLSLAGQGPIESQLKQQAMALGIADRVEFLGYVPQKDLPTVYAAADFFILPSLREPWGLSALEAMLARLPVLISSKCGCAADVVTPLNGWVFSPHNEGELECLLMKLSEIERGRREAMGDASFSIAKQYTAEKCANTVIRTVRGAAQNRRITDRPSLGRGTATSDQCEI